MRLNFTKFHQVSSIFIGNCQVSKNECRFSTLTASTPASVKHSSLLAFRGYPLQMRPHSQLSEVLGKGGAPTKQNARGHNPSRALAERHAKGTETARALVIKLPLHQHRHSQRKHSKQTFTSPKEIPVTTPRKKTAAMRKREKIHAAQRP